MRRNNHVAPSRTTQNLLPLGLAFAVLTGCAGQVEEPEGESNPRVGVRAVPPEAMNRVAGESSVAAVAAMPVAGGMPPGTAMPPNPIIPVPSMPSVPLPPPGPSVPSGNALSPEELACGSTDKGSTPARLRRLTKSQYRNSIAVVFNGRPPSATGAVRAVPEVPSPFSFVSASDQYSTLASTYTR